MPDKQLKKCSCPENPVQCDNCDWIGTDSQLVRIGGCGEYGDSTDCYCPRCGSDQFEDPICQEDDEGDGPFWVCDARPYSQKPLSWVLEHGCVSAAIQDLPERAKALEDRIVELEAELNTLKNNTHTHTRNLRT